MESIVINNRDSYSQPNRQNISQFGCEVEEMISASRTDGYFVML